MKARISPVCACRSSVLRSAPAMKIDFFAEVTMTPLNRCVFFDEIEMLAQILQGRRVENVRAGIRPIEGQHADSVIIDFAPDHGRRRRRSHRFILAGFAENPSGMEQEVDRTRITSAIAPRIRTRMTDYSAHSTIALSERRCYNLGGLSRWPSASSSYGRQNSSTRNPRA